MTVKTANPRRRSGGFTLLEVGVVIAIFGILAVSIATYQVGIIREQASRSRQQRTVADAQAILEASLDFYDRTDADRLWPHESATHLAIEGLLEDDVSGVTYFPMVPVNLYESLAVSKGVSAMDAKALFPFMLTAFDELGSPIITPPVPPDSYGLQLEFRVLGGGAARTVAALLPQGEWDDEGREIYRITSKVFPPYEHAYARVDGTTQYERDLVFSREDDGMVFFQMRVLDNPNTGSVDERQGWQGIQGVDEIVFDTANRGTALTEQNRIRGVDRVVFQEAVDPAMEPMGRTSELQLLNTAASLRVRDEDLSANQEAEIGLDANTGKAELKLTEGINSGGTTPLMSHGAIFEVDGGNPKFGVYKYVAGTPDPGVVIDYENLEVPGMLEVTGDLVLENENLKTIICEINAGLAPPSMPSMEADALCN